MTTFLDIIESYRVDGDGDPDPSGEARVRGSRTPQHRRALGEFLRVLSEAMRGSRHALAMLAEAQTTSDFPLLFGDVLDRALLAGFRDFPSNNESLTSRKTVRDFRSVSRFAVDGAEGTLDAVGELGQYPEAPLSEARDQYAVNKFGRRVGFSWEDFINDDLDALRDTPMRLGKAARRTRQKFITELYVDSSGPHASLYTGSNVVNIANGASADNPPLTVAGLQDGFTVLSKQVDEDGEPIMVDAVILSVPPALEVTARNILNATEVRPKTSGGADSAQELITSNWMRGRLSLVVDPYIPIVATSNGDASWFLFADPSVSRPALEFGTLRGHEEPEVWVKRPDAVRVGGGDTSFDDGSFDNDGISYRVRDVHGGTRLTSTGGEKATVGSNGSGA